MASLLFATALVLVFLTSWIVLPAPNLRLLVVGVGAPELSPWLAIGGVVLAVGTARSAGRNALAQATFLLALVTAVLASLPLVQLPFAARRFEGTMRAALGDDFLREVPPDR